MPKAGPFRTVPSAPRRRSEHNLNYQKVFTCDFGQLIPIFVEPMIPGDTFKLATDLVVRFQPLFAPVMHEVNATIHFFYVPYRILWDEWEDFIFGGKDGLNNSTQPHILENELASDRIWQRGDLLDYLYDFVPPAPMTEWVPLAWPLMAYNRIYNEYYRDENLIEEVDEKLSHAIQNRAWSKDYFTSALPFQQRGRAPGIPMSGTAEITSDANASTYGPTVGYIKPPTFYDASISFPTDTAPGTVDNVINGTGQQFPRVNSDVLGNWIKEHINVELNVLSEFDIADLRDAWQVQRFLEAMARIGVRYTESLQGIWGVSPSDERLDRPEYVGGAKQPIIISEVLQTSQTTTPQMTPQANMAGHGITANSTNIGMYKSYEYGIMLGILSVMPKPAYQQGCRRQWFAETRWDYPNPYFMHLSERPIESREIFVQGPLALDKDPFGWQGIWDEYRIKHDAVNGLIASDHPYNLSHWSLARYFGEAPQLNQSFIECDSQTGGENNPLKRIFAVQSEPGLIVTCGTRCRAWRPMPYIAEPGYVDH